MSITIRAGAPNTSEGIMTTNELEPTTVNITGDGDPEYVVSSVRPALSNASSATFKLHGRITSGSLPFLSVDVAGVTPRPVIRTPDVSDIIRSVNQALVGDDITIDRLVFMVNNALNGNPMVIPYSGQDVELVSGRPRFFLRKDSSSSNKYGVFPFFRDVSSTPLDLTFGKVFKSIPNIPPGTKSSWVSGGILYGWSVKCIDSAIDDDIVYVAVLYESLTNDEVYGSGSVAAIALYASSLKRVIPFSLVGFVMPLDAYSLPFNVANSGSDAGYQSMSLAIRDGTPIVSVIAKARYLTSYQFPIIFDAIRVGNLSVSVSGSNYTITSADPIFDSSVVGDTIHLSGFTNPQHNASFVIQSKISPYSVTAKHYVQNLPIGSLVADPPTAGFSGSCFVSSGSVAVPEKQTSVNYPLFLSNYSKLLSVSITSRHDGAIMRAATLSQSFLGSDRSSVVVSTLPDSVSGGRSFSYSVPAGNFSVQQIQNTGDSQFDNKHALTLALDSADAPPPAISSGAVLRIANDNDFSYAGRSYVLKACIEVKRGNTRRMYYYPEDNPFSSTAPPASKPVSFTAEEPSEGQLSQFVRLSASLGDGEVVTSLSVPFSWSSYPSRSTSIAWACTNFGRIFRTLDGGKTWAEVRSPAVSANNLAGRRFSLNSIFCFHCDDPVRLRFRLDAKNEQQRSVTLTVVTPGQRVPYFWPWQAFELATNLSGAPVAVGVRSNLFGGTGGFSATSINITFPSYTFEGKYIGLPNPDEAWSIFASMSINQEIDLWAIPVPEVWAGGESGLLLRSRWGKFRVLAAQDTSMFDIADRDEGIGWQRGLESADIVGINFEITDILRDGSGQAVAPWQSSWQSSYAAGVITFSNGKIARFIGNESAPTGRNVWSLVDVKHLNAPSSDSFMISGAVSRIDAPSANTNKSKALYVFTRPGAIVGFNDSMSQIGLFSVFDEQDQPGSSPISSVSLNGINSQTGARTDNSILLSYVGLKNNKALFFAASRNGEVYAIIGRPSSGSDAINTINAARICSIAGSISAIWSHYAGGLVNLFIAGNNRNGEPIIYHYLLAESIDVSSSWTTSRSLGNSFPLIIVDHSTEPGYIVSSPSPCNVEMLPVAPTAVCATALGPLVGGRGGILGRRFPSFSLPNLALPEVITIKDGSVLLAAWNLSSRTIDIYKSIGGSSSFYFVSSVAPKDKVVTSIPDNQWGPSLVATGALPRISLVETQLGEIVLQYGKAVHVSLNGGVSWHGPQSDTLQVPLGTLDPVTGFTQSSFNKRACLFDASGGAIGFIIASGAVGSGQISIYMARTVGTDVGTEGYPAIPGVDIYTGIGGGMIRWSGEPADGDRFHVEFIKLNSSPSLGDKSPSVKISGPKNYDMEITWDAMSNIYDRPSLWSLDSFFILGGNFSKAFVRVSHPDQLGDSFPPSSGYQEFVLHSFVDVSGKPRGETAFYFAKHVSRGIVVVGDVTMPPRVFASPRRSYYASLAGSGNVYTGKIVDNTSTELIVDFGANYPPVDASTLYALYIFSDRMYAPLVNQNVDLRSSVDSAGRPYRFARYVRLVIPQANTSIRQFVFGDRIEIGIAAHGITNAYAVPIGKESRHRFSSGFSYRERIFRIRKETESGQIIDRMLSLRPRLEFSATYDDALWHDRDTTLASLLPYFNRPVAVIFDLSNSQSVEWMEPLEEPTVKNTVGDRYQWSIEWREVV